MKTPGTTIGCDEIVAQLRKALPDLRARYDIAGLSVFGSRVRGEATMGSDVDVLVEFDRAPGFFQFISLEDELSSVLGVKVDLVMKSALRPRVGRHVLASAVPV